MSDCAPFVAGSDTSEAAAISVSGCAKTMQEVIRRLFVYHGGLTCDEVERSLGLRHQTASARIRDLALRSHIVDSGERRVTRSGRKAVVWVLNEEQYK